MLKRRDTHLRPHRPTTTGQNHHNHCNVKTAPQTLPTRFIGIPKRGAGRGTIKTIYTPRNTKTALIGAGPSGLVAARLAQGMGYSSPITIIDKVPPGRPHQDNNKRNHPLLLTTQTLDALQMLDPRLFRRLLSLGRLDTLAGFLDWNDTPTHLLQPKEHPTQPFPRWINHLCMPRDAFTYAILTTPVTDIPDEIKAKVKMVQAGKMSDVDLPKNMLPQIGINLSTIREVLTPGGTEEYQQSQLPILRVVPEKLYHSRREIISSGLQDEIDLTKDRRFAVPKHLEFNMVIAADGRASDIYASQYNVDNTSRLLTSPNDNVRVHGWCRTDAVNDMVGTSIDGIPFLNEESAWRRLNSRIFTRRTEGIRFTTFLMDYPPLHLTQDAVYRPKEPSERPDWVYWELQVARSVWSKHPMLPLPTHPAVNNITFNKIPTTAEQETMERLINSTANKNVVLDGVFMGPHDPIDPTLLLSISELVDHPLTKALITHTPREGLTVERVMYNPVSQLRNSTFHDHIIYTGEAAASSTNDAFIADTLAVENGILLGLAMASNNATPPELMARRVSAMVDKAYLARAQRVQQRELDDDVYFGDPSRVQGAIANWMEKYFPPSSKQENYEALYRFNPQRAFEIAATETAKDVFDRNAQYRQSIQSGFLDGTTRKFDFGEVPVGEMDIDGMPIESKKGAGYEGGKINYKSLRRRAKGRD